MSDLHRFIFEGMPVRGMLVKLGDDWQEILRRRKDADQSYAPVVAQLVGEMTAAAVLMQANIKFNGAVVLQVSGDGPVKLVVAEVQPDLAFRATAKVVGEVDGITAGPQALQQLLNPGGHGQCAITLDPKDRLPGQQPYQGVVPLTDQDGQPMPHVAAMLEHYMRQSEQLDTKLVLAADDQGAAGLLIQRLPVEGVGNLEGLGASASTSETDDHFERIAHLASTLTPDELLSLDAETILHRLFWQEPIIRFEPLTQAQGPRFACTCSRTRVSHMLVGLGRLEVDETLEEQGMLQVGCDFCGQVYRFDAVDVGEIFSPAASQMKGNASLN